MPRWGRWGSPSQNGTVRLDNGTQGQAATWTVGLNPSSANHLWPLASAASEITSAIKGQVNIVLPTFFPTPDQPLDPTTPNIELHVTNLASPGSTTTLIVPSFTSAMSSVNLNGIMDQAVDGWDGLMRTLQSALTQQIDAANIPVVGTAAQAGAQLPADDGPDGDVATGECPANRRHGRARRPLRRPRAERPQLAGGPHHHGGDAADDYVQLQQSTGDDHYEIQLHEKPGLRFGPRSPPTSD